MFTEKISQTDLECVLPHLHISSLKIDRVIDLTRLLELESFQQGETLDLTDKQRAEIAWTTDDGMEPSGG
jgi:hypothetical protein